jgi:hypothetical protein
MKPLGVFMAVWSIHQAEQQNDSRDENNNSGYE